MESTSKFKNEIFFKFEIETENINIKKNIVLFLRVLKQE